MLWFLPFRQCVVFFVFFIIYCAINKEKRDEVYYRVHKECYSMPVGPPVGESSHIISHYSWNPSALKDWHLYFFSDSNFNVPSHVPSWERALHLVFTVKMVAHVRRPCCGPALPSKEAHSYALNVEHGKAVCVSFGELQKFLPHVLRGMSRLCSTVHHLVTGGTVNSGDGWDFHHLYQRRRWRTCELAYFST